MLSRVGRGGAREWIEGLPEQLFHAVTVAELVEEPRRNVALLQQELQQLKHRPHHGHLQESMHLCEQMQRLPMGEEAGMHGKR